MGITMMMVESNKSPNLAQLSKMVTIIIITTTTTTLLLLQPSVASSSESEEWFPVVNVTFENQMQHAVELVCNFEPEHRIRSLMPGEIVWWTVEDVWFPSIWCFLQVSDDFFGLFWGYSVRMKCGNHCEWRIREDGLYYTPKRGEWQYQWLFSGNAGFV